MLGRGWYASLPWREACMLLSQSGCDILDRHVLFIPSRPPVCACKSSSSLSAFLLMLSGGTYLSSVHCGRQQTK